MTWQQFVSSRAHVRFVKMSECVCIQPVGSVRGACRSEVALCVWWMLEPTGLWCCWERREDRSLGEHRSQYNICATTQVTRTHTPEVLTWLLHCCIVHHLFPPCRLRHPCYSSKKNLFLDYSCQLFSAPNGSKLSEQTRTEPFPCCFENGVADANIYFGTHFLQIKLRIKKCVFMCVCVCSPDLTRSQTKVLESLELIPQHGVPVTTANYDNIRRYLIKVQVAVRETVCVCVKASVLLSLFQLS